MNPDLLTNVTCALFDDDDSMQELFLRFSEFPSLCVAISIMANRFDVVDQYRNYVPEYFSFSYSPRSSPIGRILFGWGLGNPHFLLNRKKKQL